MASQLVLNVQDRLPVGGEFQGYYGDCAEYGYMIDAGARDPTKPTDKNELDRLTSECIKNNEAGSQGQMTNANMVWLCNKEGEPYQQTTSGDLIALAAKTAGYKPLNMGFSNGQALPGNEQGVHGHCVAILDYDGQYFTVANGDSTNGRNGKLDYVTVAELQAAQPTQVTILEAAMITPYDHLFTKESTTRWHVTEQPSLILEQGMLSYWQSIGGVSGLPVDNTTYHLNAQYPGHNIGVQVFERAIEVWDNDHVVDNPPGSGPIYLGHINDPKFGVVQQGKALLYVNGTQVQSPSSIEAKLG